MDVISLGGCNSPVGRDTILSLALDLQSNLQEAMDMATAMIPYSTKAPCKGHTLPHNLWLKTTKHYVLVILSRTKALRRLTQLIANQSPDISAEDLPDVGSPYYNL